MVDEVIYDFWWGGSSLKCVNGREKLGECVRVGWECFGVVWGVGCFYVWWRSVY